MKKDYILSPRAKARLDLAALTDNFCKGKTKAEITKIVREAMIHPDQMEDLLVNILTDLNAR